MEITDIPFSICAASDEMPSRWRKRQHPDATKLAKKVRAPKKQLEAALATHPDIVKIDGHIKELEEELKVIGDR